MAFAQNINRICRTKGTTLTAVVRGLGLSSSKVSRWNDGSLPKEEVMMLLAKALDCSVMDFFDDEGDLNQPPDQPSLLDEDEEDIIRVFRTLSRRDRHDFMSMVYDLERRTDENGNGKFAM